MDSELPHCIVCLKPLAAGWRCPEHKEKALAMSGEQTLLDLAARCEAALPALNERAKGHFARARSGSPHDHA